MTNQNRRKFLGLLGAGAVASTLATPALSQNRQKWRMVTAWPKDLPGPGVWARRIAERIAAATDGKLTVQLYGAGEIVPALGVLDAVASGTAEMGHSTAFYWMSKEPAAAFFTAMPFGLTAQEHIAWIESAGGQALWDEIYAPFGVKPFMAGNIGMAMTGWFRNELNSAADLKGLKIRAPGLGGQVYSRLGATAVTVPAGEIFTGLKSGVLDGAEFLGPSSDMPLGLFQAAPYYYAPGALKPNGPSEAIINQKAWDALPKDMQMAVQNAIATESTIGWAETEWNNARIAATLPSHEIIKLRTLPVDILTAMQAASIEVVNEVASKSPAAKKVYDAYMVMLQTQGAWSKINLSQYLAKRGS